MARWAMAALAVIVVAGMAARPTRRAQEQSRIAYLNSEVVLRQTPGYASAESTFTTEMRGFQQEVENLQVRLDSVVRDFDQQSIVLSPTSRQEKMQQIRDMQQRFEQRSTELQQRAQERRAELVAPLEERIQSVIDGVRAERNLALIFDVSTPGNNIIAADRALDLTPTIIRRLRGEQSSQQ